MKKYALLLLVAAAAGLTPTGRLHDGEQRWHLIMTP